MKVSVSPEFMPSMMRFISEENVLSQYHLVKKVDQAISSTLEAYSESPEFLPGIIPRSVQKCVAHLLNEVSIEYPLIEGIEIFNGYTFYSFPDAKELMRLSGNSDCYYGIARATTLGQAHTHHESDALNIILGGEGTFLGSPSDKDKFDHFYHLQPMRMGDVFEIKTGMVHGHAAVGEEPLWFFAVQDCGFQKGLRCEGDFHLIEGYSIEGSIISGE